MVRGSMIGWPHSHGHLGFGQLSRRGFKIMDFPYSLDSRVRIAVAFFRLTFWVPKQGSRFIYRWIFPRSPWLDVDLFRGSEMVRGRFVGIELTFPLHRILFKDVPRGFSWYRIFAVRWILVTWVLLLCADVPSFPLGFIYGWRSFPFEPTEKVWGLHVRPRCDRTG